MTVKQSHSNPPLNLVVAFVFLLLYIPGLGLLLLHIVIDGGVQARLEKQRILVQKWDDSINYDNRITKVTRKIVLETSDSIKQEFYNKDGDLFALDISVKISDSKIELKSRTYYDKYGTIIARDIYGPGSDISVLGAYKPDIVKRREYFDLSGEMLLCEYFDESGVPIVLLASQNSCGVSENTILSPFPPLFFFYR